MTPWIAAMIAMFVWWFSTGAILMAVKHADQRGELARMNATLLGLPMLAIGVFGIWWSTTDTTIFGVYVAFMSALCVWGWIELAFLTGMITGPNTRKLPSGTAEWERFVRAWGTVAYHELALLVACVAIFGIALDGINQFGAWTFAVLFVARVSAKLNLFFGVPRIHVEFLPEALSHLPSHFRKRSLNWLFPASITGLTLAIYCWLERLWAATTPGEITGFALLTAITALALLEHWVMVLPIPDERLWRWMLPATKPTNQKTETGGHHGF